MDDYKIYHCQSLYKEGLYDEALRACQSIDNEQYHQKLLLLQMLIRYEKDEINLTKALIR